MPAVHAADDESTADQMLSGPLEFLEFLAVPFGYLSVKEPTMLPSISTATAVGLLGSRTTSAGRCRSNS